MSSFDSDIANGTCYYAYNKAAGSELVPCGNAAIADVPCCFGGDYCDAENSCYDQDTGNTYLAGCTDPQYTDSTCPWKSDAFAAQEWVGLIRCDEVQEDSSDSDSDDDDNDNDNTPAYAWAGCSVPPGASTSLQRLASCDCTGKATLFVGGQALTRHASLPPAAGGTISWASGFTTTSAAAASTTTGTSAPAASTAPSTWTFASTSTTAATSSSSSSAAAGGSTTNSDVVSAGAKAGIAVGSIGASMALGALALMFFLHKRRRRRRSGEGHQHDDGQAKYPAAAAAAAAATRLDSEEDMQRGGGLGGYHHSYYGQHSNIKSELPADEPCGGVCSAVASPTTEQEVHEAEPSSSRRIEPQQQHAGAVTPAVSQSDFGGDHRTLSLVSELSNSDDCRAGGALNVYYAGASTQSSSSQTRMMSIAELPG